MHTPGPWTATEKGREFRIFTTPATLSIAIIQGKNAQEDALFIVNSLKLEQLLRRCITELIYAHAMSEEESTRHLVISEEGRECIEEAEYLLTHLTIR